MACNKPMLRYFPRGNDRFNTAVSIPIPCGRCAACRKDLVTMWSDRCTFEMMSQKSKSTFLTLTYNDDSLPKDGSVSPDDWNRFKDRLRKKLGFSVRYYMTSEYGSENYRPHYHAMLFGFDWQVKANYDALFAAWSVRGKSLGFISCDYLNPSRVRYVLKYMEKEHNQTMLDDLASRGLAPLFHFMSKGIGRDWFFRSQRANKRTWWLLRKRQTAPFAALLSRFARL